MFHKSTDTSSLYYDWVLASLKKNFKAWLSFFLSANLQVQVKGCDIVRENALSVLDIWNSEGHKHWFFHEKLCVLIHEIAEIYCKTVPD